MQGIAAAVPFLRCAYYGLDKLALMVYNIDKREGDRSLQPRQLKTMQFDSLERAYLLEHFRSQYNECKRSTRPGSQETAETWAKLQQLLVKATA